MRRFATGRRKTVIVGWVAALVLIGGISGSVGVDYALFILTRFRNGLDEGLEKREAAIKAVDTAGRAVLFAARPTTCWPKASAPASTGRS